VARGGAFRPWRTELAFGQRQAELPSLRLNTPGGNIVELHGKIDRVDLIEREAAFAVLDYKLRGDKLSMARVYHGLSLQLLTYLLVLQAQGDKLAGKPLTPAAAFYVTLLRKLERTRNPDEALAPSDPLFHLQHKQRGVFDRQYIAHLDRELAAGETSDVVQASIKKDGNWGDIGHSDAVEANEFRALMRFVRRQIMKLVDQVLRGNIAVAPYLLGKVSPCPGCDYRSVCRFEVAVNRYRPLENVKKTEVLARIIEEVDDGA
jgi:ATP-dependent helicase/nuclease subunit B